MSGGRVLFAAETHTAGEPTRVVVGGIPPIPGRSMADKLGVLARDYDHVRKALMWEPRGHAGMFGAIIVPPVRPEAHLGVVFLHSEGFQSMCGHGTMGVVRAALDMGMVPPTEPVTEVQLDTPAGPVRAVVEVQAGRVGCIRVENRPAFLYRPAVRVSTAVGEVSADICFGGSFFALVDAKQLGLEVSRSCLGQLVTLGVQVREAANREVSLRHPLEPHLAQVDLVTFYEAVDRRHFRNVTVFGRSQWDRSPCGTGTSALMAALYAQGSLGLGEEIVSESVIGSRFGGRLLGPADVGGFAAVVPEIRGTAHVTGYLQVRMDPSDPLDPFLVV